MYLKSTSKSRENKKSPNFAQQSGLLFGMSQKLGKTSLLVIPAPTIFQERYRRIVNLALLKKSYIMGFAKKESSSSTKKVPI